MGVFITQKLENQFCFLKLTYLHTIEWKVKYYRVTIRKAWVQIPTLPFTTYDNNGQVT